MERYLSPQPVEYAAHGGLAAFLHHASCLLQHQLFGLGQFNLSQPERSQPLRPLLVGQVGRHHFYGFHAAHQNSLSRRRQFFCAVLVEDDAAVGHRGHGQPDAGGHIRLERPRANVYAGALRGKDDVNARRPAQLCKALQPDDIFLAL